MAIPRILHHIWVGGRPLPSRYAGYIRRWRSLNPLFEHRLWGDDSITPHAFPYTYDLIARAAAPTQKADVMRYEILYHYGGFYIDCDFEPQRSLDAGLVPWDRSVVAVCNEDDRIDAYCSIGFIAAPGRHPIFLRCCELVRSAKLDGVRVHVETGPALFRRALEGYIGTPAVHMIPTDLLYPYGYREKHRAGEAFPSAYAIHHWGNGVLPDDPKAALTHIYQTHAWNRAGRSVSGPGSDPENVTAAAAAVREVLRHLLTSRAGVSVVDLGCGDMGWMGPLLEELPGARYTGIDIVDELIDVNRRRYPQHRFICDDIASCDWPECDLLVCRDVLFHNTPRDAMAVVSRMFDRRDAFIVVTSSMNRTNAYDFADEQCRFRPLNLFAPPFSELSMPPIWRRFPEERYQREILVLSGRRGAERGELGSDHS